MSQYGRQAFCIYKSGGKTITTAVPDIFMVSQNNKEKTNEVKLHSLNAIVYYRDRPAFSSILFLHDSDTPS